MAWLRRAAGFCLAAVLVSVALMQSATPAEANVTCDTAGAITAPIGGAVGIGSPVGDACDALGDAALGAVGGAVKDAVGSVGRGVFGEITSWASDGAVWLLGEVVKLTEKTTSPNLLSKGFVRQYRQMCSIACVLALMMLILAVLESLGRGDAGVLWRTLLVTVPVAAIATSAAFALVQLLIAATDGFSEVISHSTAGDARAFFKGAIKALATGGAVAGAKAGPTTGAGRAGGAAVGAVGVPLFVAFIASILAAVSALVLWLELLMRDAAIYAVAAFMPLGIAASIWPRWRSALQRTAELIVAVVCSKFCIVAVIALAASLAANSSGRVEQVLAAGALLLVACFSPLVLLKFMPFAEGAASAALHRQSAGVASLRGSTQVANSVQMMRMSALANWGTGGTGRGGGVAGGGSDGGANSSAGGTGKAATAGRSGAGSGTAGASAGGAAGVAALPIAASEQATRAGHAASRKLASTAAAGSTRPETGAGAGSSSNSAFRDSGGQIAAVEQAGATNVSGAERPAQPPAEVRREAKWPEGLPPSWPGTPLPEPAEAKGGEPPAAASRPPRPQGEVSSPPQPEQQRGAS